jgi:hypothetical protein
MGKASTNSAPHKSENDGQRNQPEPDVGDAYEGSAAANSRFHSTDFENAETSIPDTGPDPFNPANLRLTQDFAASIGVKKLLLVVPVRTPDKSWFVRVHPDPKYRVQTALLELKEQRETYLVAQNLWPDLATEPSFKPKLLATAISRQKVLFLWPVNLPRADGRTDNWSSSALEAIEHAAKRWVRITANMAGGHYDVHEAHSQLTEPEWPEQSFRDLLEMAFKGRFIDRSDHHVLRLLRGEI